MVKMNIVYQGQKHCESIHEPSKSKIETDAPRDNHGKGECFSPTDLMGAALGSCLLTTMAIVGEREGLNLDGISATVEKAMTPPPRKIESLTVRVTLPAHLTPEQRLKMEETARSCPVARTLHPEVKQAMMFEYKERSQ
jgi:putative redox protein